jgi:hypothetical protein
VFIQQFNGERKSIGPEKVSGGKFGGKKERAGQKMETCYQLKRNVWLSELQKSGSGTGIPDLKPVCGSSLHGRRESEDLSTRAETQQTVIRNQIGISHCSRPVSGTTDGQGPKRTRISRLNRSKFSSASTDQLALDQTTPSAKPLPKPKVPLRQIFVQERQPFTNTEIRRATLASPPKTQQSDFKRTIKEIQEKNFKNPKPRATISNFDKSWSRNDFGETSNSMFGKSQNCLDESKNNLIERDINLINIIPSKIPSFDR